MTHTVSLATFSVSVCVLSLLIAASAATKSELRSLLEFRKGIERDPTNKTSTWKITDLSDPKSCPDSWLGISCDSESGSIVGINLDRLGLKGELKFSTLLGLTSLRNLTLSGNSFSGRFVPALGSMSSLQFVDLSDNQFYGPIPGRIGDLWGLNYLNLSANRFEGGFPSKLRNLQQLRALDLHANEFWGDVGEIFSELKNVEFVDLSHNQFFGSLSLATENISSIANTLHHLNLSRNALNGGIFKEDSIGLFKNLEVLDLGDNQISGELPPFGALPNLKVLRLGHNQLFGSVPEELLQSSIPLQELDLSRNGFTGSLSEINSTSLNLLNLSMNGFSGTLPSTLKRCLLVDLSGNMFEGDISALQEWEASLEFLDLSSNRLSGTFPNLTSQFEGLTVLNIRNNSLSGSLPPLDVSVAPKLSVVDLSLNQLNGSIPSSFFSLTSLRSLNLSRNHLTGAIPLQSGGVTELLVLPSYPQLGQLDLSTNSLTGVLPSEIGNLGALKVLNLANNRLSGELPSELNKLSGLEHLDLSNNKFKGEIPDKLSSSLSGFNVSSNDLSGTVPGNLRRFPPSCFRPGNSRLHLPGGLPSENSDGDQIPVQEEHHRSKSSIRIAIIVASIGAAVMILFALLAYHRSQLKEFHGRSGFAGPTNGRDVKNGRPSRPSFFNFRSNVQHPSSSLSFSNDHLLTANSRSLSGQQEFVTEVAEHGLPHVPAASSAAINPNLLDDYPAIPARNSSPGSPLSSSPHLIDACDQPVTLDVYSPDRLAGELFFLDASLKFTAEELSRAPAEVLGRSSHGTLYKATLDNGHMLTVKWLRVGLVRHKKEFAKEVKKIGSIRHPNIVPLRAYYWGPREQERLLLADYTRGDSLALHLYETTPRRYAPLSFSQRLKLAVEVARCLSYLHDRGMPHGNLKPTNIVLAEPDYSVRVTDYGLHRLMTPSGIAEQILNMGALGYCAPELATASKPVPTLKADVYSFGVILMELLTRRSAGDIISGQSGAVDLTDWVRLCDQESRRMDCVDRDIAGGEEYTRSMDGMLGVSLRCILPVNERPNIRQVLEDLSSLSA